MKHLLWIFISCITINITSVYARGGDEGHNGGGLAEQNTIFSWMYLRESIQRCAELDCYQDPEELSLLHQILENFSTDFVEGQLLFINASERPDIFVDPALIWASAPQLGAKIYINLESLYIDSQPVSIPDAMRFLLEAELTHFDAPASVKKTFSETLLDFSQTQFSEKPLVGLGQPQVRLLSWDLAPLPSRLFLSDEETSVEMTPLINEKLKCPTGLRATSGFFIQNIVWSDLLPWNAQTNTQPLSFSADIQYICSNTSTEVVANARLQAINSFLIYENGQLSDDMNWIYNDEAVLKIAPQPSLIFISNISISNLTKGGF